jgi:6-phosphogluconolactonase (cycloisomerase 2 family)
MLFGLVCVGSASTLPSRFAYVVNLDSGSVSIYTTNPATGQLRSNGYVNVVTGLVPESVAVTPSGKFAYIIGSNNVSAYKINAKTGDLTLVKSLATGQDDQYSITIDPSSKFAYVANFFSNSVSAYKIGGNGALTPVAGSPFAGQNVPFSVAIDPSGGFLYAGDVGGLGSLSAYTINATTGALAPIAGSPFLSGCGGYGLTIAPSGKFGYVQNPGSDQITAFSINPTTGVPTEVAGSPFPLGGVNGQSMAMTPSGDFIYVVGANNPGTIVALTVNSSTGVVTPVTGSPFATGNTPLFATADPNGALLYVTNRDSNEVWTYAIAGNGALTILTKARTQQTPLNVALGVGTASVKYTPKFAYVANQGTNTVASTISAYKINATSGKITGVSGSPFADGGAGTFATSVTVDPSGRFGYVANAGTNSVSAYTINASTGALTAISGSPFPAGSNPTSVTVDPSDRFAYVANGSSFNISAFTINATTGALTAIGGSPFPAGGADTEPLSVTVDPTGQFVYVASVSLIGGTGNIAALAINPITGALTAVSGSPFSTGSEPCTSLCEVSYPYSVAVDPSGEFAYVANSQKINSGYYMSSLAIDAGTGALTFLSFSVTLSVNENPFTFVATDPLGQFVYAAEAGIDGLSIDSSTGGLANLTNSPFSLPTGAVPFSVAVDPSGKFVYVADAGTNEVTAFTIAATTGDLTAIAGDFAVAAGNTPVSVVTTGIIH